MAVMCTNNLRVEHFFPAVQDDSRLLSAVDLLLPAVQDRSAAPVPADHAVLTDQFALPDPYAFQFLV
jgi:hypothetical protein